MEQEIIQKAGLTASQAKVYSTLLHSGELTPVEISARTSETRTNVYAILSKLESMNLVRNVGEKKAKYQAESPSNLELLAEKRRKIVSNNERVVKNNMSALLDIFYANNEAPGSKTLLGEEGIKEVHRDVLATGETVYLIPTPHDSGHIELIDKHREQRAAKGIHTVALTPATKFAQKYVREGLDAQYLFERTLIPVDAYTSPVEIMIYGKKVAFITYSKTEIVTLITSPAIAAALREIFLMLQKYWQQNFSIQS